MTTAKTPSTAGTRQVQVRTLVDNRQARHLYHIEDKFTAGISLEGWEVKSILAGQATFNGGSAFVRIKNGEAFLEGITITPLPQALRGLLSAVNPLRPRKLLLKRAELKKLAAGVSRRGMTAVPLALTYSGKIKLELSLAKGKAAHDKRDAVKARELTREMQRVERGSDFRD